MKSIERKHQALLDEAERRRLPDIEGMEICFRILSLAAAIDGDCARLLKPYALSEGRFVILFLLEQVPDGLAPHLLAERAGVTRATVTGLLDGMTRDGLVRREQDLNDRRSCTVMLTDKGKTVAQQVFATHGEWIGSLLDTVTADERKVLLGILNKVRMKLGQPASAAGCGGTDREDGSTDLTW